ncbi:hypothetical protein [Bradyrhizobium sp. 199]|uniref:hypothetical protein n=1 Tax=Bradyrhizobium sp. 199 TaxID=2782664 RepID=UPI001FF9D92B|nr:hypothetical protein [Bradyrhizobium sp. 199]MCK1362380.1 hypothetical protein [Bradyrhizobium sp. 199]
MADATRAAFFSGMPPIFVDWLFHQSDTNGFRTLADRTDDPQARRVLARHWYCRSLFRASRGRFNAPAARRRDALVSR